MSDKLNILFLGPAYPYRGGIASFTDRLSVEFEKQGHHVELYTFTIQYPSLLFPGKTQLSKEAPPSHLKAKRVINSINPFNWINVGIQIQKSKPDLILVRYWIPFLAPALGTILRFATKNTKTKVICIADNIIPHEKRPGDHALTAYFNKCIDGYVVMSDQVKQDLLQLDNRKPFAFLPHPIFENFGIPVPSDQAKKELNIHHSGGLVLFFGLIRAYKGLDLLLEAFSKQQIKDLNLKLIIAGEFYDKKEKYSALIEKLGIQNSILIEDAFIPNSRVPLYMSAADVLVQPYRHATQSGVSPLAMHFNLPMIVTDVGGLKEMVSDGKTGLVVQPTADGIANGLIEYFNRGKSEFEQNIPAFKKQFSWESMYEGIMKLYQSLNSVSS